LPGREHHAIAGDRSGRRGALEYLEQPRADAPKFNTLQTFIVE